MFSLQSSSSAALTKEQTKIQSRFRCSRDGFVNSVLTMEGRAGGRRGRSKSGRRRRTWSIESMKNSRSDTTSSVRENGCYYDCDEDGGTSSSAGVRRVYGKCCEVDGRSIDCDAYRTIVRGNHEPVVVRRAFEKTRATAWDLEYLMAAYEEEENRTNREFLTTVRVRTSQKGSSNASSSSAVDFVYAEESHEFVKNGDFKPPSVTERMPFARALSNVLFSGSNGNEVGAAAAYIQSELPEKLKSEIENELFNIWNAFDEEKYVESQKLRLWLSKPKSVSPLHFDASVSTLTQMRGEKTFLLFSPFSLNKCELYPNWHPLRRRSKLSIEDSRIRERLLLYEATLSEGDMIIFPPRWLHHVESKSSSNSSNMSVSVTRRYVLKEDKKIDVISKWLKNRDKGNKAFKRLFTLGIIDESFLARTYELSVIELDQDGKCPKLCETKSFETDVQEKWKQCVSIFVRSIEKDTATSFSSLVSICVRGSIARAAAVDFESDCDLVLIFENVVPVFEIQEEIRARLETIRVRDFAFVKKIDMRFESMKSMKTAEQLFALATSSLYVSGSIDIPNSLPRMAPAQVCYPTLQTDVLLAIDDGSERAIVWACKRCIRAAFESRPRTRFTREITRCCEIVCEEDFSGNTNYEAGDLCTALLVAIKGPTSVYGVHVWREMSKALLTRLRRGIVRIRVWPNSRRGDLVGVRERSGVI